MLDLIKKKTTGNLSVEYEYYWMITFAYWITILILSIATWILLKRPSITQYALVCDWAWAQLIGLCGIIMKSVPVILVLVALTAVAAGEKARFDNYRIYNVKINNVAQLHRLQEIDMNLDGVSIVDNYSQLAVVAETSCGDSDKCRISN